MYHWKEQLPSMDTTRVDNTYLTELNMDVRVRRVATQMTILPGTTSEGTKKDIQAVKTNNMLGT